MTSSVYSAGTASVSNGSAIVIGTGTAWKVALVTGGMFSLAGLSVPIASVESDTSLTLSYAWPGLPAAGGYAIARETSEAVRAAWINDRLAQILTKLSLAGIHPDGAGTLAERNALSPAPPVGFLWLRVEVGFDMVFYKRTSSGWDGPFSLKGDDGHDGPAGVLNWIETGWATGESFAFNAGLTHNGTSYRCFVPHTSTVATEPGIGANWQAVWKITAAKGAVGPAGTIAINTVTTVPPGAPALVVNVGSPQEAVLNFEIPQGNPGNKGDAATVAIGTVTTLPAGQPATVENVGAPGAAVFNFGVPKGHDGLGAGDMVKATFDPTGKNADAFAMDNMAEGTDAKVMTAAERAKLEGIGTGADKTTPSNVGSSIAGTSQVAEPADGDRFAGVLAGGTTLFWTTFGNIKARLKTYFDTVYVPLSRSITAGSGLTGGGDQTANRTLAIDKASAAHLRAGTADKVVTPDIALSAMDWVAVTAGATPAVDHAAGVNRTITHSANATMANPTNAKLGWPLNIDITPGAFTTSWAANYKFGTAGAPPITARRIAHFVCRDVSTFVFLGLSDPS